MTMYEYGGGDLYNVVFYSLIWIILHALIHEYIWEVCYILFILITSIYENLPFYYLSICQLIYHHIYGSHIFFHKSTMYLFQYIFILFIHSSMYSYILLFTSSSLYLSHIFIHTVFHSPILLSVYLLTSSSIYPHYIYLLIHSYISVIIYFRKLYVDFIFQRRRPLNILIQAQW